MYTFSPPYDTDSGMPSPVRQHLCLAFILSELKGGRSAPITPTRIHYWCGTSGIWSLFSLYYSQLRNLPTQHLHIRWTLIHDCHYCLKYTQFAGGEMFPFYDVIIPTLVTFGQHCGRPLPHLWDAWWNGLLPTQLAHLINYVARW